MYDTEMKPRMCFNCPYMELAEEPYVCSTCRSKWEEMRAGEMKSEKTEKNNMGAMVREAKEMQITINIHDYLSNEEIKELALQMLGGAFNNQLKNEASIERVLSNLTSEYIFGEVCKSIYLSRGEIEDIIARKVQETITGDSIKYQVFRRKDVWDRSESPAVKILDDILSDSKELIKQEVEKRIKEYDFRELREEIEDTIYGVICEKLRG